MTPSALVGSLRARGFTLTVVSGSLRVAPASALTAGDREAIRAGLPALIAALAPAEPWDTKAAVRLMESADGLVERLGVDGTRPEVTAAAAMVTSACAARDMETLRFACREFEIAVRQVAAERPQLRNSLTG
jgi:hypothetical protein